MGQFYNSVPLTVSIDRVCFGVVGIHLRIAFIGGQYPSLNALQQPQGSTASAGLKPNGRLLQAVPNP